MHLMSLLLLAACLVAARPAAAIEMHAGDLITSRSGVQASCRSADADIRLAHTADGLDMYVKRAFGGHAGEFAEGRLRATPESSRFQLAKADAVPAWFKAEEEAGAGEQEAASSMLRSTSGKLVSFTGDKDVAACERGSKVIIEACGMRSHHAGGAGKQLAKEGSVRTFTGDLDYATKMTGSKVDLDVKRESLISGGAGLEGEGKIRSHTVCARTFTGDKDSVLRESGSKVDAKFAMMKSHGAEAEMSEAGMPEARETGYPETLLAANPETLVAGVPQEQRPIMLIAEPQERAVLPQEELPYKSIIVPVGMPRKSVLLERRQEERMQELPMREYEVPIKAGVLPEEMLRKLVHLERRQMWGGGFRGSRYGRGRGGFYSRRGYGHFRRFHHRRRRHYW